MFFPGGENGNGLAQLGAAVFVRGKVEHGGPEVLPSTEAVFFFARFWGFGGVIYVRY